MRQKKGPHQEPRPFPECPRPVKSWPTGSHNASRRSCGRSRASCWEKQRTLGLVTLPSRRGLPSCSGAVSPASQHAPRHPKHGHSPTPAALARALRERLHARTLRLRLGRQGKQASELASEGREALRARARSVGRGAQRIAQAAELVPAGCPGGCRSRPRRTWYSPPPEG